VGLLDRSRRFDPIQSRIFHRIPEDGRIEQEVGRFGPPVRRETV
jgi:hypothetical protein